MKLDTSLDELKRSVSLCLKCGMCTYGEWPECYTLCPIYRRHRVYTASAGGLVYLVRAIAEGKIGYTPTMAELAYECTLCGVCDMCQVIPVLSPHVSPSEVTRFLRHQLVEQSMMPEGVREIYKQIEKDSGYMGTKANLRVPERVKDDNANTVLFVGGIYSEGERRIYESAIRLLEKAGKTVAVFDEGNFGCDLYDLGFWGELGKLLASRSEQIKRLEGKEVLFINPHCQEFMTKRYPEIEPEHRQVTGRHFGEFLVDVFRKGKLKAERGQSVKASYHDPCHLSRGLGIHEAPREVLSFLGVELIEMGRKRENAYCCGAGGRSPAFRVFSSWVARERIKEFEETGAELLITACPYCKEAFQKVLPVEKRAQVKDLIEFVDEAAK